MLSQHVNIEDRLSRHEDVLRSYKEKFEEHKRWLQGQRDLPSFVAKEPGAAWEEASFDDDDEQSRGDAPVSRRVPVHDTLLERGKLYEQKREAAREEALRKELKQLRSKPQISEKGQAKVYEKPVEERFLELAARREKDLEQAKRGREEDAPQYSFKPKINKKGKQAASRTSSHGAADQWKQRRDQKLEEARKRQLVEMMSMQRDPHINEHSRKIVERKVRDDSGLGRGPHYTHADSLLERDRLAKLQLWEKYQRELAEQQPGNPKITPFAASLARDGNVCERLYENSADQCERKNYLLQKKYTSDHDECVREPRITMRAAMIERSQRVEDDLLERHEVAQARKEEHMKQAIERERHLHQPAINPVSDEIASRLCQTARERLYGQKVDYSALQEQYSYQQPQQVSKPRRRSGSARRSTSLGAMRGKDKKRREELRDQQDRKQMEECTFHPKTGRGPKDRGPQAVHMWENFHDRTAQRMKKKEEKLKEARKERDIEEVTVCPFTPNIGYQADGRDLYGDDNGQIYGGDGKAWGFDDFVDRQRSARKLQTDKERGAWVTGRNWKNEVTVPKEFALGKTNKENVKSLQQPLSPPRLYPQDEYARTEDESYEQDGAPPPPPQDAAAGVVDPRDLPQKGLFSEGANSILHYTPQVGGQPPPPSGPPPSNPPAEAYYYNGMVLV